jgi:hypothetical protein
MGAMEDRGWFGVWAGTAEAETNSRPRAMLEKEVRAFMVLSFEFYSRATG